MSCFFFVWHNFARVHEGHVEIVCGLGCTEWANICFTSLCLTFIKMWLNINLPILFLFTLVVVVFVSAFSYDGFVACMAYIAAVFSQHSTFWCVYFTECKQMWHFMLLLFTQLLLFIIYKHLGNCFQTPRHIR